MASDKYVIQFNVDAQGAISNTEKVNESLAKTEDKTASLRKELKKLQSELTGLKPNTKEFDALSRKAGEIKDQLNDVSEAINANAGNAFEALGNNVVNLKDRLFALDFEGVQTSFKSMGSAVSNIKIKDLAKEVGGAIKSFAQLGKALLLNPIFLIGSAVALIIANFDKLSKLVDGVSAADEKLLETQKERAAISKEQLDSVSAQENILKLQGKTEEDILKMKLQALDTAILDQKTAIGTQKVILDGQVQAAERNKDILLGILKFITAPIKAILMAVDAIGQTFGKDLGSVKALEFGLENTAKMAFDPDEVKKEGELALKESEKALVALENQRDGFILSRQEKERAASEKIAADRKAAAEKEKERLEADRIAKETLEAQELIAKKLKLQKQQDEAFAAQVKANQERIALEEQLAEDVYQAGLSAQEKEISAIRDHYFEKITLAQELGIGEVELAEEQEKKIQEIKDRYAAQELAATKANNAAKVQIAQDGISALIQLTESFTAKNDKQARAQFKISKALRISEATINAYKAASNALATTPLPPPFPQIAAGISLAAGFAQVRNIAKQQYGESGGGGNAPSISSGGGGGASGPPAFNPVDTSFLQNRQAQIQPTYVLAGAVNNAQEVRNKVQQQARL